MLPTLPFLLLLIHLSLCRGQAKDDAGDTTTTTTTATTRDPGPVSATFETLEVCTQRCECPCRDTTVTMEDGREVNMFYCARPKVVQGTSVVSSLFSTIVSSPFLLALSLILLVVLIAFTLASSVFGCCDDRQKLTRSRKQRGGNWERDNGSTR
ncbi:hypothetical protein PRIPAC_96785 [Pristionchus pacificus]|uniref:Uncharacterized protein n=1 Tax=Pristionchus pacificus TaxID=54126 RepID=A0A2A6BDC2_PRIPA|nr:hypothetical protein PRIPAC_96785 [Pristionchus pacificus]|eukprot:PDM63869.1 hypothetical protein PRIPAC_49842 [Pristionchus pacificus]